MFAVRWSLWSLCVTLTLAASSGLAQEKKPISAAEAQFFEAKVRPLLAEQCYRCHGAEKQKGHLRVDSLGGLLSGGDLGPAIVPHDPGKSLLIKAVRYTDDEFKMPPSKKLSREEIDILERWVTMGAPWPGSDAKPPPPPRKGEMEFTDRDRQHWAFQPVQKPKLPTIQDPTWAKHPIDALIRAKLESKGLEPNPPASKQELVRRVYFDLIGLPPTPAEVRAFLDDTRPDAYERLLDDLLARPQYGEKWARHWLDLVHYAETNSYERDNPKPHIWRYRDYVIHAFNTDKPYDRFLREQLAGDELYPNDDLALTATGYYRLGVWDDEPTDKVQAKYDGLDDIIAVTGQTLLGLTIDCARCHNHKIDPIPQKDYYRLMAFFHNINHFKNGGPSDERPIFPSGGRELFETRKAEFELRKKTLEEQIKDIEDQFKQMYPKYKESKDSIVKLIAINGTEVMGIERTNLYRKLRNDLDIHKKQGVPNDYALCVTEPGPKAPATQVLIRGNPHAKGDEVQPGFLAILNLPDPELPAIKQGPTSGRRSVLANWIASPDNPLTARVFVNRLWQQHFGRGIVRSSSDFGLQGVRPTHPELLDWLASEFIQGGWKIKDFHKLLMTSNTYKMSSRSQEAALKADPANDYFWRYDMRRLSAEEIRDSILAVSGNLNLKMTGPPVYPAIPKEVLAGQSVPGRGWGKSSFEEQNRRSVYVHVKRSLILPILESFDVAETDRSVPVRFSSTQPTQALSMLNGDFLNLQAKLFAERLMKEAGPEPADRVKLALNLATSRTPTEAEVRRGVALIDALTREDGLQPEVALRTFCLVVLNLNEFLYLD